MRYSSMCPYRIISASVFALILAACDSAADTEPAVADTPVPPVAVEAANLSHGTLGTVRYEYDASALTRAEVEIALPPDFEQTAFAVKFIPSSLSAHLGAPDCSFGSMGEGQSCTARAEVGFAIALLERPLIDYTTALARATPSIATLEPAMVDEHEGMSFVYDAEMTKTRYTFLPSGGRTLLLVDRYTDGVDLGAEELAQVRDSIDF